MSSRSVLIEIGTEELPPKALLFLSAGWLGVLVGGTAMAVVASGGRRYRVLRRCLVNMAISEDPTVVIKFTQAITNVLWPSKITAHTAELRRQFMHQFDGYRVILYTLTKWARGSRCSRDGRVSAYRLA